MDKRKQNGGNSTKAYGFDKRKNQFKDALESACTVKDVEEVLRVVCDSAKSGDMKAAQLFLSYYLGRPIETKDVTVNQEVPLFPVVDMSAWGKEIQLKEEIK